MSFVFLFAKKNVAFNLLFFASVILFGLGQIYYFYLKSITGLMLSVFSAALCVVIYFKGRDISFSALTNRSFRQKPDKNLLKRKRMNKLIVSNSSLNLDTFKPIFLISAIGIVLSFVLAGIGQFFLAPSLGMDHR
jgi:hypothetical protein